MSSQNGRTANLRHALETTAVEIESRRLHLNQHSQRSLRGQCNSSTAVVTVLNLLHIDAGMNTSQGLQHLSWLGVPLVRISKGVEYPAGATVS
jgi:hypothetical protein